MISNNHATLTKNKDYTLFKTLDKKYGFYVNSTRINKKILECDDKIFICGITMIFLNDQFLINNPFNNIKLNSEDIVKEKIPNYNENLLDTTTDDNEIIYSDNDYYIRQPRTITSILEENI